MTPSEEAVEIVDIFHNIITNNLHYCALCLRTEKERKLVPPNFFMQCLSILKLKDPLVSTICHVCEASSKRMFHFVRAINFSLAVNRYFKDMRKFIKSKNTMSMNLDWHIKTMPGLSLERAWASARRRYDLVQTEVLCVTSNMDSQGNYQLQETEYDVKTTTAGDNGIVVIEDDDEPSLTAPSEEIRLLFNPDSTDMASFTVIIPPSDQVYSNTLVPPANTNTKFSPTNKRSQYHKRNVPPKKGIVHTTANTNANLPIVPVITNVSPAFMPILPANTLVVPYSATCPPVQKIPCIVPIDQLLEYEDSAAIIPGKMKLLVRQKDSDNVIMHKIVRDASGGQYVPSLRCRFDRGRLVEDPTLPAVVHARGVPAPAIVSTSSIIDYTNIELDDAGGTSVDSNIHAEGTGGGGGGGDAAKRLQGARIDWEDKIPMDVISFVDATDPHADKLLNPQLPDKPWLSKRPHIDRDVIDLC